MDHPKLSTCSRLYKAYKACNGSCQSRVNFIIKPILIPASKTPVKWQNIGAYYFGKWGSRTLECGVWKVVLYV